MVRKCPKCKTDEYNNKNIVMMINECGHPLCQNCVENIFARNANRCPYEGCAKTLKKNSFWEQLLDDPKIERENFIRKRLDKIYNMHEDNFGSLKAYNDYLEELEDVVFNLVNEIDVEETERRIKIFKESKQDLIDRNRRRLNPDQIWINKMLEEEENRKKRLRAVPEDEKPKSGIANPKDIIDELRESDLPAEVVLDRQRKIQIEAEMEEKQEALRRKRDKQERYQRRQQDMASFAPLRGSGEAYIHIRPMLPINGPKLPTNEEIQVGDYLSHVRRPSKAAMAGGYLARYGCLRAIFEARQDLFSLEDLE